MSGEVPQIISAEWLQTVLSWIVFAITGLGAFGGVVWSIAQHEKSLRDEFTTAIATAMKESSSCLEEAIKSGDAKRARIYERFDEYKNLVENQFVRKETCGIMHSSTAQEVAKIYARMDGFDSRFNDLNSKLDNMKDLIIRQGIEKG
jgi:hypothetical protein